MCLIQYLFPILVSPSFSSLHLFWYSNYFLFWSAPLSPRSICSDTVLISYFGQPLFLLAPFVLIQYLFPILVSHPRSIDTTSSNNCSVKELSTAWLLPGWIPTRLTKPCHQPTRLHWLEEHQHDNRRMRTIRPHRISPKQSVWDSVLRRMLDRTFRRGDVHEIWTIR